MSYPPGGAFSVTALDNSKLVAIRYGCYELATNEDPVVPVEYHDTVAHFICARYLKDKVSAENVAKSTHRIAHKDTEGSAPYDSKMSNDVTSALPDKHNVTRTVGCDHLRAEYPLKSEKDHSCLSLLISPRTKECKSAMA